MQGLLFMAPCAAQLLTLPPMNQWECQLEREGLAGRASGGGTFGVRRADGHGALLWVLEGRAALNRPALLGFLVQCGADVSVVRFSWAVCPYSAASQVSTGQAAVL